jgi:hypothetical protein
MLGHTVLYLEGFVQAILAFNNGTSVCDHAAPQQLGLWDSDSVWLRQRVKTSIDYSTVRTVTCAVLQGFLYSSTVLYCCIGQYCRLSHLTHSTQAFGQVCANRTQPPTVRSLPT